ncbi:expressed unknown protein [Seminavis robusta]|uniref:Uncharacterized protein n=1 Tax=Seminavis robusta TaxID=568900 RepID=A0A9N8HJF2_9STRA|nr:expressed unknown protein [Seminavis robusta]|eukprot:Sro689_g187530.1 n/a (93) ;mRNA; r:42407-42760
MLSLSLDRNALSGRIPKLGDATKLQELDLSNLPKLTGAVPSELSGLSGLSHLDLAGSRGVTGTMPTALCDLDDLFFSCTDFLCGCYCQCPPS